MLDEVIPTTDCEALRLLWSDGSESRISAATLRREARDAWTKRELIDHGEVRISPGLTITALQDVGIYGLNVHFSDGHEKAIYPIPYLRELSDRFDN